MHLDGAVGREDELECARVWEMGCLAVEASSRGRSQIVLIGLLREMCLLSQQRGIRHWVAFSTRTVYRLARHFNPSARLLPENRSTPLTPPRCATPRTTCALSARSPSST